MPKIAHIADIHFRGMSRHQEYRDVFERCFEQMRELKPDLIYVGGDIVHSKTQGISPELIDCLTWWFQALAEIAPTHIILGNHDGIMLNRDRQDTISPIITALDNPRLFLYKKSGVYPTGFDGFNWCVFSCFDEKGWKDVKPVKGDVNLALFHGGVWGSKTDIDWDIEGEVDTTFFDGFDFTLLGDIHRVQFLTPDKRIAYCGSTIQQNYGEDRNKGFLFWDIRSRDDFDVEFHRVEGTKPFITVDWAGSVPETIELLKSSPKGARLRIRAKEPIPTVEWRQLCNELEITKSPSEVVSKDEHEVDTQQISTASVELFKDDLRDPDTHVQLFREYFSESNLTPDEWKKLEELAKGYIKTIIRDGSGRSIKWGIRKLEFDNTFSYGKGNRIDFDKLNGITGIFGRNARGKSSIVGTLIYTLFNTTDRGPIKNLHVINTRKNHCVSKVTIEMGEDLLRFERHSVKHKDKKGKESAITHLNVFKVDEDGKILKDHSQEQRRVTEKVIRGRIGDASDFLLTSLASQGDMNAFIKQRSTARKSVLTRFLGLDIFDKMGDMAREESKFIQAKVKSAPDRDWDALITEAILEKKGEEQRGLELEKRLANLRLDEQKLQIRLGSFENADVVTPADVSRQKKVIEEGKGKLSKLRETKKKLAGKIDEVRQKIERIESVKSQISIDDLRQRLESQRALEASLVELRHSHERELTLLNGQEKSIARLSEVPCDDMFPTCKFIKDSHQNKQRVEDQKIKVVELLDQLTASEEHLKILKTEDVEDKIAKYEALINAESEFAVDLARKEADVKNADSDIRSIKERLERAEEDLRELESKMIDADVDAELTALKESLHSAQSAISKCDGERIATASKIGQLKSRLSTLKKEKAQYQELKQQWRIYELFIQGVSKRGIPLQIIMSQLPIINAEIAKILQGVVSFTVEFEADPNSNAMDVYINYGDSRRIIEVASGMEKMIASLAIRVALINVSSLPKTSMFIIDEGFGTLDDVNVEACNRLLVSLKKWFDTILIITHVDGVKDVVDNVIDIQWSGKDAKVIYD